MSRFKTAPVAHRDSDWEIARRKGTQVRYQNRVTTKMTGWCASPEFIAQNATQAPSVEADTPVKVAHDFVGNYLNRKTVAELRSLAGDRGIKVLSKARKSDIIAALTN